MKTLDERLKDVNMLDQLGVKRLEPFSTIDSDGRMKFDYEAVMKMQREWGVMLDALIKGSLVFSENEIDDRESDIFLESVLGISKKTIHDKCNY